MKTVSGEIVSSKPVSLSKAAKILSKFASRDNGASPALVHYLNRASDSFREIVELHKELRGSSFERKSKKHRSEIRDEPVNSVGSYEGKKEKKKKDSGDVKIEERSYQGTTDDNGVKSKKKKVKKESDGGNVIATGKQVKDFVKNDGIERKMVNNGRGVNKNVDVRDESKVEKKGKKRKSEEIAVANGDVNESAEKQMQNKKRKKVKSEVDA